MRKPVYYAYVAQESHPDSQGEKNTWWTKVGVAFPHHGKSGLNIVLRPVLPFPANWSCLSPGRKIIHHRIRAPSKPCRNHP